MRLDHRLDGLHVARLEHRRRRRTAARPATRCGPSSARARRRTPGRRCAPAGRRCRDACGSPACRAHRRSAARTPCARRRPRRSSSRARSAVTVASAPAKSPVGLGARRQMWPLSRWVCASTNAGSTMRPASGSRGVIAEIRRARRRDRGDAAVVDEDIDAGKPLRVARRLGRRARARRPRPSAALARSEGRAHVSRLRALSCQRCSSR